MQTVKQQINILNICSEFGFKNDILYDSSKSDVLIRHTKEDVTLKFPFFKHSDCELDVCHKVKYLEHIEATFTDDDLHRRRYVLYAQANA